MAQRDLFPCVDAIRASEKFFDANLEAINRLLFARGECELYADHDVNIDNVPHTATLRLNIRTRSLVPQAWTISLKLHGIRIDGIDHEWKFRAVNGQIGRGWHRHIWDPDAENAERGKIPVAGMDDVSDRTQFLHRALALMRVKLDTSRDDRRLHLA